MLTIMTLGVIFPSSLGSGGLFAMLPFLGGVAAAKPSWPPRKARNAANAHGMKRISTVDRVGSGGGPSLFFVSPSRRFRFVVEVRGMEEGGRQIDLNEGRCSELNEMTCSAVIPPRQAIKPGKKNSFCLFHGEAFLCQTRCRACACPPVAADQD